jgi:type II secretory pathway component PulJ
MSRASLRGERGELALTQLLVAILVFMVVLGATLTVFEQFVIENNNVNERNDAQDRARNAVDQLARTLRNLASPTPEQPQAIDRAGAQDLVFQTVDPKSPSAGSSNLTNVKRVRYCVDSSTGTLWSLTQTWTTPTVPAMPSATACPGSGWTSQQELVEHVTNGSRSLFTYNAAAATDISSVHVELYLDVFPSRRPLETTLSSGVFLRNQNRRPAASFTWARNLQGIVLNGSASSDPEGQPLKYYWYDSTDPNTPVGKDITFTYQVPAGSRTITLKVTDPAGLEGTSTQSGVG